MKNWFGRKAGENPIPTPAPEGPDGAPGADDPVSQTRDWVERSNTLDQVLAADHSSATANPDTAHHLRKRSREISRAEIDAEAEERRSELEALRRRREALAERERRAVSEGINDAEEAAADLEAIRGFERESSPITSARLLADSALRWRRSELGYSLVGAGLSAVGITAMLSSVSSLPLWGAGAVAAALEVVTTVRVVDLLGRLARLREQDRSTSQHPQGSGRAENGRNLLVIQCVVMLSLSVVLNLVGLFTGAGALGAIGMSGALLALFAGLGSQASTAAAAEVVSRNMSEWKGADWEQSRTDLRQRASGAHIPSLRGDEPGPDVGATGDAEHDGYDDPRYWLDQMSPADRAVAAQVIDADPGVVSEALDWMSAQILDGGPVPDDPGALVDPGSPEGEDIVDGGNDAGGDVDEEGVDTPAQSTQNPVSTPEWTQGGGDSANGVNTPSGAPEDAGGGHRLSDVNTSRSEAARRRLSEAVRLIRDRGEEPTKTAVRKETGMDLRTIGRHWDAVTKRNEEGQ